ncbi:MAG: 3-phosphoshikimate 1-carboxyvinyltransferase [Acidimicrobiales bacterium]|jgi:3-phosphoshikimate 1-carboxyvinyltransferase
MAPLDSIGLEARALRIVPAGQVKGVVTAPSSKSVTNRLLVMAALAEGTSTARHPLVSDDTVAMAVGLGCFGARVTLTEEAAVVSGTGGAVEAPAGVVGAGLSGTTLRFLAAVSLLAPGPVTLDGEPPLRRRPLGGLLGALAEAGARVKSADGHAPVVVEPSGFTGGHLVVDAAASSQFASALLLVAPYARSDVQLRVENLGAGGYVEMTVDSMRRWGAAVTRSDEDTFIVTAGRHYLARDEEVEYDASAAAHLYSLAMAAGGEVTVRNAVRTLQPDSAIVDLFAQMGAEVSSSPGRGTTVRARTGQLRPVTVDLKTMPDQLPTVAVLCALAPGVAHLTGLGVARGHETDRVAAVATELAKLGADVETESDGILIRGGRPLHGGLVETYDDHRMAMAFSVLGAVVPGVTIAAPGCVAKTYPCWWADLSSLGVGVTPA